VGRPGPARPTICAYVRGHGAWLTPSQVNTNLQEKVLVYGSKIER